MLKKFVKFLRKSKAGDNVIVFLIMTAVMAVIACTVSIGLKDKLVGPNGDGGTLGNVINKIDVMEKKMELGIEED